jgi:dTMP kinase
MKKVIKALLIAIEGSDGAGKATQTNLLYEYLRKQKFQGKKLKVARVSFPRYNQTLGGTLLHEVLKSDRADRYGFSKTDPYVASKLYAMDREESIPYLESLVARNDVVIFDRYVESNLLHQGGKFSTNKDRLEFAKWLFRFEYGNIGLPQPDSIIYLTLPFSISLKRAELRARATGSKLDAVEKDKKYVRQGHYAGIFYANHFKWDVVDGVTCGRELTEQEVHTKIREIVIPSKLRGFFGE